VGGSAAGVFLFPARRRAPSRGFVVRRMGSAAEVPVVISSDEDDAQAPAAGKRKSPDAAALAWAEGILDQEDYDDAVLEGVGCPAKMLEIFDSLRAETGIVVGDEGVVAVKNTTMPDARGDDDDDDDCVMLDGDPDKPVAVAKEEGRTPRDAAEDELQIVAEKGEVLLLRRLLALICPLPLRVA